MIRLFHASDLHFGAEDSAALAWLIEGLPVMVPLLVTIVAVPWVPAIGPLVVVLLMVQTGPGLPSPHTVCASSAWADESA